MAKTEEKPKKKPARPKKGLHGWKAALTVFGCGTLAAFGVFGIILGLANFFVSTLSSGVPETPEGVAEQTGEPVEDLAPGELDLCAQDVQYAYGSGDSNYSSDNYVDTAIDGDGEDRVVEDECSWDITPEGEGVSEPWDFTYSYQAVVSTSGEKEAGEVASDNFGELVEDFSSHVNSILDSGESDLSERSFFYYGKDVDGSYFYRLIGQTRSTVYVMHFISPEANGEIGQTRFLHEARHVSSYVEPGLQVLVPD